MLSAQCLNCSASNKFPAHALNEKVRCKNCRHIWRLTTTLPAVTSRPPAVPAAYRTECLTGAVIPGVIERPHLPPAPPMPDAMTQIEALCASQDLPFSMLFTKIPGDAVLKLHRSERGTHAIDRYCGTAEGRERFTARGAAIHYDRNIEDVSPNMLSGFSCAWCGATEGFLCGGCGYLVCKGASFKRGGVGYGVCRVSCPMYNAAGIALEKLDENLRGRTARFRWDDGNPPPSNFPQLRWRP